VRNAAGHSATGDFSGASINSLESLIALRDNKQAVRLASLDGVPL
jgi:hypothetical protein